MHFYYNILWTDICAHEGTPCYILDSCTTIVIPYNTILTYQIGSRVTERKRAREAKIEKKARWREKQRDRGRICLTYPASQSCSVCYRCSVQRVAKRARVLLPDREALLDDIDFDWTCADALS